MARPKKSGVQGDLIYDVGAHRGEDSAFYLRLGYRVVAVEADPRLVAALKERFAHEISEGRLMLVDAAIAPSSGEVVFYSNDTPALSTANPEFAECSRRLGLGSRETRVRGVAFADLLKQFGTPSYLKVDIEGSDRLCLEGLRSTESRPDSLSIETSDLRWAEAVREFQLLRQLGYRRFKIVRQGNHASGTFRTRSGQSIHFDFGSHASGPFGEHLGGEWLSFRQALWRYWWIFIAIRIRRRDRVPGRLLGRIPVVRSLLGRPRWYDTHARR